LTFGSIWTSLKLLVQHLPGSIDRAGPELAHNRRINAATPQGAALAQPGIWESAAMEMHTPSRWTFWLSLALVLLAIVAYFVDIPYVSKYELWIAVVGYIVLVIGCMVKTT
jgi:hypothetical protein